MQQKIHLLRITAVSTDGWLPWILLIFYIPTKKPVIDMGWTQAVDLNSDVTDARLRRTQ